MWYLLFMMATTENLALQRYGIIDVKTVKCLGLGVLMILTDVTVFPSKCKLSLGATVNSLALLVVLWYMIREPSA